MLLQNPSSSRAQWYDRNPLSILQPYYSLQTAPHSPTQRWSYTVPAGRKCNIEAWILVTVRSAAAAPVLNAGIQTMMTLSGGSQQNLHTLRLWTNNVGDQVNANGVDGFTLYAGDNIISRTFDSSTGGTCDYTASMKGSEFDA